MSEDSRKRLDGSVRVNSDGEDNGALSKHTLDYILNTLNDCAPTSLIMLTDWTVPYKVLCLVSKKKILVPG